MYSTALEFEPQSAAIEKCETDFVVVAVDPVETHQASIQILIGEAKTSNYPIGSDDVRKLGKLADAVPPEMAQVFIMFVKTDIFTADEVTLAKSLNSQPRHRVILWSQDELLEPCSPYERSEDRLGKSYASRLSDMVQNTDKLWP
ncbi:MAG: hypothetical protein QOH31_4578 [Verrucomicrobiota bacterium]|jgi:hypothetical protein